LFAAEELDSVTDKKEIGFYTTDLINYDEYKPLYNDGAQKVRAVTASESNYFNILQSIAETFECWMSLEITRAEANEEGWQEGAIKSKTVSFKNYAGNDNHASFQYGINLKDIQRTFASKNIVTKLIVK
jgi:phage minor structural protein